MKQFETNYFYFNSYRNRVSIIFASSIVYFSKLNTSNFFIDLNNRGLYDSTTIFI